PLAVRKHPRKELAVEQNARLLPQQTPLPQPVLVHLCQQPLALQGLSFCARQTAAAARLRRRSCYCQRDCARLSSGRAAVAAAVLVASASWTPQHLSVWSNLKPGWHGQLNGARASSRGLLRRIQSQLHEHVPAARERLSVAAGARSIVF